MPQGRHTHLFARMGAKGDRGPAIVYAIFLFVFPVSRTLVEQAYFYRVQKVNMSACPPRIAPPKTPAPCPCAWIPTPPHAAPF